MQPNYHSMLGLSATNSSPCCLSCLQHELVPLNHHSYSLTTCSLSSSCNLFGDNMANHHSFNSCPKYLNQRVQHELSFLTLFCSFELQVTRGVTADQTADLLELLQLKLHFWLHTANQTSLTYQLRPRFCCF